MDYSGHMLAGRANLSAWALRHRALTLFFLLAVLGAGLWAYASLGRAEDPPFNIKQMVIEVDWPGASAAEMAREVTDRLERKLEELPSIDNTESETQPGRAVVTVSLRDDTPPSAVPELWYEVRKKVGDIASQFPTGVQGPFFNDEFGDVFGLVYGVTGDGFSLPQLRHVLEDMRESLLSVPGIGKVELFGIQEERIFVEFSYRKLAELGIDSRDILDVIRRENGVVAGGFTDTRRDRVFVRTGAGIDGAAMLRRLPINLHGHLVPLADLVTISRGVADPPASTLRVNGKPALALGISMAKGNDILELGHRVEQRMAEIAPTLPLGVRAVRLNDQSAVVATDVGDFEESFLEALAIVLAVSFISLGWRTGLVVAISVPLVLAGTFVGMKLLGIDLQRISLGAMIIALGLLVDDAIIAVETMLVKLEDGWDRLRAGSYAYTATAFPMLTGTLVTAAGYLPVGLAQSSTGEYTRDIFRVVGLALLLSWFAAVLFVPFLGSVLLRPTPHADHAPSGVAYDSGLYRRFRGTVRWCVRRRWFVLAGTGLAFAVALFGFMRVPQQFFPSSDRLEVLVDLRLPEGSSFVATQAAVERMEVAIGHDAGVDSFVAYTGVGTPRFFLAFAPVLQSANYAQFVINTKSVPAREALLARLTALADAGVANGFGDARIRVSRLELGPPVGYPVQFRIVGPDPERLRAIATDVRRVMRANPHLRNVSDSWGNLARVVYVSLDQDKARLLNLSSQDVSGVMQTVLNGLTVTHYREGTDLIPVVARAVPAERTDLGGLPQIDLPSTSGRSVPLAQVAAITYGLEEPVLNRRNRTPALLVRADIGDGAQAPDVTAEILPGLAAIKAALPVGYRIETAGAVAESAKGQASVSRILPLMGLVTLTLLMVQLQSFGRVAMVLLTAPLGLIGVTAALLITGAPFGFVALLGFIALAGIIMRNSVILVDQTEQNLRSGLSRADAIVEAAVRRARPIMLTAAAAILALIPLAFSVFWGPMAIAIMGGLVSATVLTLFFLPALYAAWTRIPTDAWETPDLPSVEAQGIPAAVD